MEERRPPSADDDDGKRHTSPSQSASLETYVVQIPKDQIYRVPPPEHARIVEEYSNRKSSQEKKTCWNSFCFTVLPAGILCIVALIAIFAVRATVYNPQPPNFTITFIRGNHLNHGQRPKFDMTLQAKNPNSRMSISYQAAGKSSLFLKNQQIGQGTFLPPSEMEPNTATNVHLLLSGNDAVSSLGLEKALAAASDKSMTLNLSIPVGINSWIRSQSMNLKISCDFKVKNPLTGKPYITNQQCTTEP